jgi:hypothetical protein
MGGEWNHLYAVASWVFRQRLSGSWRTAVGMIPTAGTTCLAMRIPGTPSACPSMQQAGGAAVQPVAQQSCSACGPAGVPGMKQTPRVPGATSAARTRSALNRRRARGSVIVSIRPPERARVKTRLTACSATRSRRAQASMGSTAACPKPFSPTSRRASSAEPYGRAPRRSGGRCPATGRSGGHDPRAPARS